MAPVSRIDMPRGLAPALDCGSLLPLFFEEPWFRVASRGAMSVGKPSCRNQFPRGL